MTKKHCYQGVSLLLIFQFLRYLFHFPENCRNVVSITKSIKELSKKLSTTNVLLSGY